MEKQYYISKEQFAELITAWKKNEQHSASQHIIYNILRSKPADLGFSPRGKNIQGNNPWYSFNESVTNARWICRDATYFKSIFGIDVPSDLEEKLKGLRK